MRNITFLTGTRADFGKLKSLINSTQDHEAFDYQIFATGMHLLEEYGKTIIEIEKAGFKNIYQADNQTSQSTMDLTLAKTIQVFSAFIKNHKTDLIVVHGDRVEALAGAIVGSLNNIFVAHVEGGEISGTVDELIRHSVSKLAHIHFVSNDLAVKRLIQMGELESSIFNIGSPDLDVIFADDLPARKTSLNYYNIPFEEYALVLFHPVTTDSHNREYAKQLVDALMEDDGNYVVIYPNNDLGSQEIKMEFQRFRESEHRFKLFPSVRFEHFITLLKNAQFLIGNSSAGIHEAPYLGTPTINMGRRQENRDLINEQIIHIPNNSSKISAAIAVARNLELEPKISRNHLPAATQFMEVLHDKRFWQIDQQKQFRDLKV